MITLKKATISDAVRLTGLSREIYLEHFLYLWHPGGVEWYLENYAYGFNKIRKELSDPGIEYYFALSGEKCLGYIKLVLNTSLEGFENFDLLELERIYVYKNEVGKGVGKQMIQFALKRCTALKKESLFLKAMDSSTDAIEFYKRLGFKVCGSMRLPMPDFSLMKEQYRGMLILQKLIQQNGS